VWILPPTEQNHGRRWTLQLPRSLPRDFAVKKRSPAGTRTRYRSAPYRPHPEQLEQRLPPGMILGLVGPGAAVSPFWLDQPASYAEFAKAGPHGARNQLRPSDGSDLVGHSELLAGIGGAFTTHSDRSL